MAELLVFNKDHWMDKLTPEEIAEYIKKNPKWIDKYNARTRRGDIIEIQEDGHFTGPKSGYPKEHFAVVVVKGTTKKDLIHMRTALVESGVLKAKHKYNISVFADKAEILLSSISAKSVTND